MRFIDSSGRSAALRTGVRVAAEGAVLAAVCAAAAGLIWREPAVSAGARTGAAAAWAASTASLSLLAWARGRRAEAFWWAFGGGVALRAVVLAGLCVWGMRRADSSLEGLLLSYGFTLLALLLTLEFRHLRLR